MELHNKKRHQRKPPLFLLLPHGPFTSTQSSMLSLHWLSMTECEDKLSLPTSGAMSKSKVAS